MGRACDEGGAFGDAGGRNAGELEVLGPYLPVLRARMDALLHDVLALGSPTTAVAPRGGAFDVGMQPNDSSVVKTFLKVWAGQGPEWALWGMG